MVMKKLRRYLKSKPQVAISVPALLCFVQFIVNLFQAFRYGTLDGNTMNQLLSSADGFETVVLVLIMFALNEKDK